MDVEETILSIIAFTLAFNTLGTSNIYSELLFLFLSIGLFFLIIFGIVSSSLGYFQNRS